MTDLARCRELLGDDAPETDAEVLELMAHVDALAEGVLDSLEQTQEEAN